MTGGSGEGGGSCGEGEYGGAHGDSGGMAGGSIGAGSISTEVDKLETSSTLSCKMAEARIALRAANVAAV